MRPLIYYVTTSSHKEEENKIFVKETILSVGKSVDELFDFVIWKENIHERLEIRLERLVELEAKEAYRSLRVPCIVEHEGLVLTDYKDTGYPGGLTKPMWNSLQERFVNELGGSGRRVIATAVVAYCDGKSVQSFIGEMPGSLVDPGRGSRTFYWDTVFVPDSGGGKTYAEIVEADGLSVKVRMSQSSKAMTAFLESLLKAPKSDFWTF